MFSFLLDPFLIHFWSFYELFGISCDTGSAASWDDDSDNERKMPSEEFGTPAMRPLGLQNSMHSTFSIILGSYQPPRVLQSSVAVVTMGPVRVLQS